MKCTRIIITTRHDATITVNRIAAIWSLGALLSLAVDKRGMSSFLPLSRSVRVGCEWDSDATGTAAAPIPAATSRLNGHLLRCGMPTASSY